jgi:hypothetical protein
MQNLLSLQTLESAEEDAVRTIGSTFSLAICGSSLSLSLC